MAHDQPEILIFHDIVSRTELEEIKLLAQPLVGAHLSPVTSRSSCKFSLLIFHDIMSRTELEMINPLALPLVGAQSSANFGS